MDCVRALTVASFSPILLISSFHGDVSRYLKRCDIFLPLTFFWLSRTTQHFAVDKGRGMEVWVILLSLSHKMQPWISKMKSPEMSCKIPGLGSPKNISDNLLFMLDIHFPPADKYEQLWQGASDRSSLGIVLSDMPAPLVTWSSFYWSTSHFLMLTDMLDCYFRCFRPTKRCKGATE